MLRREVRLAEKDKDQTVRMIMTEFGDLIGGVAIASADFSQIFARHAIEPINEGAALAGGGKQFVEGSPVVSPVEFETHALTQFIFFDLAAQPLVEDVLIAREDSFDAQYDGSLMKIEIAQQRSQIVLRIGQSVIVAHQNSTGFHDR